jgi:hypothetical protein
LFNNKENVFVCDKYGIQIGGQGIIKSSTYDEDKDGFPIAGTKIDLSNGKIFAKDFTLVSPSMTITNDSTVIKTNTYIEGTSSKAEVLYYYKECKPTFGYAAEYVHEKGKAQVGRLYNWYNNGNKTVRVECDKNGNLITETLYFNGNSLLCVRLRNLIRDSSDTYTFKDGGTANDLSEYYCSYWGNNQVGFTPINDTILTCTTSSEGYYINGGCIDLSNGKIALGNGTYYIVFDVHQGIMKTNL